MSQNIPMGNAPAQAEDIRASVRETYARAVTTGGGCCQPTTSCCGAERPAQKGAGAQLAGYDGDDLRALPDDAVENSFGCGNPVAFAGVQEGETVVDLGSGAGIDILLAGRKVGPTGHVIGIDMTDEMIARARKNIEEAGASHVEVRKGLIEALPVEEGTADWVISNCVINLSPEKDKVFAEVARVLKPGGRISISDIVVEDLPDWALQSMAMYGGCVAGAISEQDYIAGLEAAGMTDVKVEERLVYDATQLGAFAITDELIQETGLDRERLLEHAGKLTGKVWSARFTGRKL